VWVNNYRWCKKYLQYATYSVFLEFNGACHADICASPHVAWSAGEEASLAAVCELFVALGPRLDWSVGLGAGYVARVRRAQRSGN